MDQNVMRIFEMIKLLAPEFEPNKTKIHLANWNGQQDPLDVFLGGKFPEWQAYQNQRNFKRQFVISLIKLTERDKWLFAGLHRVDGEPKRDINRDRPDTHLYHYPMSEVLTASDFTGRMVATFARPGRNSYLNAERWIDEIKLSEVYSKRLTIGEFPGYRSINLSFDELKLIVDQDLTSWRSSLSNVAGVYLISDTDSGQLYVGSASGAGGFWQRWRDYTATGHGGNKVLREICANVGLERAKPFHFSILEIADIHTGHADILMREAHWKNVLLSRSHGWNRN